MRGSTSMISALTLILALTGAAFAQYSPRSTSSSTNGTAPIPCTLHSVSPLKQEEIFYEIVDALLVRRQAVPDRVHHRILTHHCILRNIPKAYSHFEEDYINHNPFAADGIASDLTLVVPIFTNPAVSIQILHQVFVAPYGWVHYRVDGLNPEPVAVLDLFLFNGSCVHEHWDIIQERPANATNPHALF